ncbi:MAG: arabinan endo-1,5-alpha-L-arabinosidase [Phocaeicola dorei]|uniref:Family 43 glycosylhydrolase n=1 Tax=Phocaeicola dorei TaxID=357276 RepID=A0AB35C226_9BACT|nr:family 43 glycosylhydrolase [Phocaeicola dorei]MBP7131004.1 family 43 glycosylhydrolase [Bacteroides sp.]RGM01156.1 arabinan endo-1,5-alpha-L-arabinosidase [Bacteroides sp. 3_1_33FAA]MBD9343013.1 arabinan endo-1,5-alpha-L-arabinosidase [Phocaeicola dorei]MBP8872372.1 family 43 glycosylhydrolase [Bacteroides sp.]MBT1297193.1 family 43 glycosylhydrolase [Phocaeicola dorei]
MKKLLLFWIFLSVLFVFAACSDSNDDAGSGNVAIGIPEITATTTGSLTVTSSVSGNTSQIVKKGFCYSVNTQNPTIKDNVVDANENFSATISGLTPNTSYYIRAYVYGDSRYTYSDALTATTENQSIDEQLENYVAPTYVDNYVDIAGWEQRDKWNLANVHDPTVVLAEDGYYYMYQTDASYGNAHTAGGHFHSRRSKDLVNWEYLGGVMQSLPDWVIPKLNEIRKEMGLKEVSPSLADFGYWAPCVRKVRNGLYRMYYSIVCPGTLNGNGTWSERAFIGLLENSNPANNNGWEDKGYVITNASDKELNFNVASNDWANCYYKWNAIDPSYLIDNDGKHYLIYGSWHSGIAALEVDTETGKPNALPLPFGNNEDIAAYGSLIATRKMGDRWQGSEGPEIVYNAATGYYYLFMAYDALEVPYNTRVCRSKNIYGPYLGIDGTDLTHTGGDMLPVVTHPYKFNGSYGWVGISHCAVFDDGNGNWYYASQGRYPENVAGNPYSNALMMGHVRSIRWTESGWPVVMPERYGAVPQVAITEDELVGNWEHIDLSYSYGKQKESSTMTLAADHTITAGSWKGGTWSYNADKQILTANGVELCLQRETDWEASPRTHTIVYAGYTNSKTYWGKKSK